jgi:hypothetical protein
MKKLFFMVSCLVVLGSSLVSAQALKEPAVITVNVHEYGVRLYITTANGGEVAEPQMLMAGKKQSFAQLVAQEYQKLLNDYAQRGYVLQGIIPGKQSGDESSSTLLFVKFPKP